MYYCFTPKQQLQTADYYYFNKAFNEEECDKIISLFTKPEMATLEGGRVDEKIRISNVCWLSYNDETKWVFDRLSKYIIDANAQYFEYDLSGFYEDLQLTKYDGVGHYNWHVDTGVGRHSNRKISFSLQLSDPNAYEGCDLEFFATNGEHTKCIRERGTLAVFSSYKMHRVTKLLCGTRHSLVGWTSGPAWR